MNTLVAIQKDITVLARPEKAELYQRYFKTDAGQYGESDTFLGVTVPDCRRIAKRYYDQSEFHDLLNLLASQWHEYRLVALMMLVEKYAHVNGVQRQEIFNFYLENTSRINNWDLVDVSAYKIIGRHIFDHRDNLDILDQLAESNNIWERRIAIISTYYFLTHGISSPTLHIAEMLLADEHDLIQKATGWMLRELGKRIDEAQLIAFLHANYNSMSRMTLRYAIERFDPITRKNYLAGDLEQSQ